MTIHHAYLHPIAGGLGFVEGLFDGYVLKWRTICFAHPTTSAPPLPGKSPGRSVTPRWSARRGLGVSTGWTVVGSLLPEINDGSLSSIMLSCSIGFVSYMYIQAH